jgi:hypothetical protein
MRGASMVRTEPSDADTPVTKGMSSRTGGQDSLTQRFVRDDGELGTGTLRDHATLEERGEADDVRGLRVAQIDRDGRGRVVHGLRHGTAQHGRHREREIAVHTQRARARRALVDSCAAHRFGPLLCLHALSPHRDAHRRGTPREGTNRAAPMHRKLAKNRGPRSWGCGGHARGLVTTPERRRR